MLDRFLAEAEGQIRRLYEALESKDNETLRRDSHRFKGGAATLTAMPLAATAGRIEDCAILELEEVDVELLRNFEREFDRLRKLVQTEFGLGL